MDVSVSRAIMFQQQVYVINTFLMLFDAVSIVLAGYGADYLVFEFTDGLSSLRRDLFFASIFFVLIINNYAMGKAGLYSDKLPTSFFNLVDRIFKAVVSAFVFLSSLAFLLNYLDYTRSYFIFFAGLSFFYLTVERTVVLAYLGSVAGKRKYASRLLTVGERGRADAVVQAMEQQLSWGHRVVGRISVEDANTSSDDSCLGGIEELPNILRSREIDEVVFAMGGDRSIELKPYVDVCRKMGIKARILPALWDKSIQDISVERCQGMPFLTLYGQTFSASGLMYKRVLDILGGLVGSILFFLMYPCIAAAIKLDSPGPVLFKQQRVGRNGRIFNLYKFRSMRNDAEERKKDLLDHNVMSGAMFKMQDDPRITRVGKFLRQTSLDEFPQFLNVVLGDMSLVGTRPPTIDEVNSYELKHRRRISQKPGITGLWQVSGRSAITDFEKVVELDCQYLENWRFSLDIKILCKTVFVVFQRMGAV